MNSWIERIDVYVIYLLIAGIIALYYMGAGLGYVMGGVSVLSVTIVSRLVGSKKGFCARDDVEIDSALNKGLVQLLKVIILVSSAYIAFLIYKLFTSNGLDALFSSYSSYPVNRDILYWYRHSYFNGTLEFIYLFLIGICIYECRYRQLGIGFFLMSIIGLTIVGLTEAIVLARYYYPAMVTAIILCLGCVSNGNKRKETLCVILILSTLITVSYGGRTFLSKHSVSPFTDRDTMYQGIEIREGTGSVIKSLGFKNKLTLEEYQRVRARWNLPMKRPKIKRQAVIRDLVCNLSMGPVVDQILCPKIMQAWLRNVYQEFYSGTYGPVLPTLKYWQFAPGILRLTIIINGCCLLVPLGVGIICDAVLVNRLMFLLGPYWTTRVVSFFRGDPLHAGLSLLWVYCALLVAIVLFSRLHNSSRVEVR